MTAPVSADGPEPRPFSVSFGRFLRLWAWATASGILVGLPVIGVGGRIAMRIAAATSSDAVQGAFTDDAEQIGEITFGGTVGFLLFGGILFGSAAGWLYALIRPLFPAERRHRMLAGALVGLGLGTPILVSPGERDFSILEPLWLVVALFVAIPVLYGTLVPVIADRLRPFYESAPMRFPHILAFAPLVFVVLAGVFGISGVFVGFVYAALAGRQIPPWIRRGAQGALAAAVLFAGVTGAGEILDVDGRDPRPSDFIEPEFD